jgi:hypothetical protein
VSTVPNTEALGPDGYVTVIEHDVGHEQRMPEPDIGGIPWMIRRLSSASPWPTSFLVRSPDSDMVVTLLMLMERHFTDRQGAPVLNMLLQPSGYPGTRNKRTFMDMNMLYTEIAGPSFLYLLPPTPLGSEPRRGPEAGRVERQRRIAEAGSGHHDVEVRLSTRDRVDLWCIATLVQGSDYVHTWVPGLTAARFLKAHDAWMREGPLVCHDVGRRPHTPVFATATPATCDGSAADALRRPAFSPEHLIDFLGGMMGIEVPGGSSPDALAARIRAVTTLLQLNSQFTEAVWAFQLMQCSITPSELRSDRLAAEQALHGYDPPGSLRHRRPRDGVDVNIDGFVVEGLVPNALEITPTGTPRHGFCVDIKDKVLFAQSVPPPLEPWFEPSGEFRRADVAESDIDGSYFSASSDSCGAPFPSDLAGAGSGLDSDLDDL